MHGNFCVMFVVVFCCLLSMSFSVLSSLFSLRLKLTQNKNARHIFPHHFFPVAMVGITCLYMHSLLYTFHTRSMFFKYLHFIRSYDHHCTRCTCTSCAPTTRLSIQKVFLTLFRSFTEQTSCVKKNKLYHLKCLGQF